MKKRTDEPFRTSLYIPGKLHKLLAERAKKENRSVANMVQTILLDYLKKENNL